MTRPLALIVDDLETARAAHAWMGLFSHHPPIVAVVDYPPGTVGRELLEIVKAGAPQCHVLTMTTDDSVHLEREAVVAGVLVKPFDLGQMVGRNLALELCGHRP